MTALAAADISHRYGRTVALDRVSVSVAEGEILCLVGPSGCGKSTLLRLAAGLETLQAGRIAIGADTVAVAGRPDTPPEARNIGFLFQDFALFPHLTVIENTAFGLHGLPGAERRPRARAALARVGMEKFAESYPHMLSGGQQQRVALARAMAPAPRLFLLDEPFSGIDARLRRRLLEDTWRVLKESKAASVVVTHDPEEAMLLGDRIAVMRAGRVLQIDTPDALYRHPRSAFVAEFMGEVNKYRGIVDAAGQVATPLGPIAAPALAPGAAAVVVVRQHGIAIGSSAAPAIATPGAPMVVAWVRTMGATQLLQLRARSDDPAAATAGTAPGSAAGTAYVRLAGPARFAPGDGVHATVDRDEVFVFPAEPPTSIGSGPD